MVKQLLTKDEFADFLKAAGAHTGVIIDFTATWCGPCKKIAPIFAKLAEDNPSVMFAKVDVDENADVAEQEGINAMPTFILYKDGKRIEVVQGANEVKLAELVAKAQK